MSDDAATLAARLQALQQRREKQIDLLFAALSEQSIEVQDYFADDLGWLCDRLEVFDLAIASGVRDSARMEYLEWLWHPIQTQYEQIVGKMMACAPLPQPAPSNAWVA